MRNGWRVATEVYVRSTLQMEGGKRVCAKEF